MTGIEWQSAKYTTGLSHAVPAVTKPLAFAYESTGVEIRFTNAFDPKPASRQVNATGSFHGNQLGSRSVARSEVASTDFDVASEDCRE